jgi:hypothetical protein
MIEANRFCIELWSGQTGKYHVWIQPIEYLGHEEFKNWLDGWDGEPMIWRREVKRGGR